MRIKQISIHEHSDLGLAQVTDTHMLTVLAISRRGPAGNVSLLCPFRDPQASVAQGVAQPWGVQRRQVIILTLERHGVLTHIAHHSHRLPLGSQATLGRVRRTRGWEGGEVKGSRWPQRPATSPQLGAMPCAYVLAPSVRQDEEQALACQPLPVTPETLTSLS